MSMMGQLMKPKKTEITDKLRKEINKVCVVATRSLVDVLRDGDGLCLVLVSSGGVLLYAIMAARLLTPRYMPL